MNFLSRILPEVEERVKLLLKNPPPKKSVKGRSLIKAIERAPKVPLIAEIKRASPSAGEIRPRADPVALGREMVRGGAIGLSILTEPKHFHGDPSFIPLMRRAVMAPLLRKDFIIHEIQLLESAHLEADAVLLIAKLLGKKLRRFIKLAEALGMEALVEVTSREEARLAIAAGANLIGINNRNLETLEVDLKQTALLAPLFPEDVILVSESGIETQEDVKRVMKAGADAVLVGTSIMKSRNVEKKVRELVEAVVW